MVVQAAGGEAGPAIWPCPSLVALEIDPAGYFLPVMAHEGRPWSPRQRALAP